MGRTDRPTLDAPAAPRPARHPRLGLLAIALCVLAPAMDTSVNIAMPSLTAAFDLAPRDIQWVVICYMLAYGSLMLTCGKLGDLFGHRRILQTGLLFCAAAFTACALSPVYPALLAGRMLQGIGIALTISCAPALTTALYPETARTWVLGIYGALFALGSAAGPVIGSWLIAGWGWSGVFAFRVPVVLAAWALSWLLPRGLPDAGTAASPRRGEQPFDWPGAVLLVTWMSALILALSGPHAFHARWPDLPRWLPDGPALGALLLVTGALALAAFVRHESRFPEPILRPALFRSVPFAVLNGISLLVSIASFAVLLIVPYFLVRAARLPIHQAGLMLAMQGIGIMAGSWTTGLLGGRVPPPRLAFLGVVLAGLGLLAIGQWLPDTALWAMLASVLLQGFGHGLFQVAYNDSVIAALPVQNRGVAGSLTMMVRTLGIIGGATGLSALFELMSAQAAASGLAADAAFLQAFHHTVSVAGIGLLIGVGLSLVRPRVWRG